MFYEGTLQEGISSAVGQQKLVLCFVTDEEEESQTWENEYLGDEILRGLIQSQAVALRLIAGSEEAGYLSQIFPLPKTPTVVIMKHGELKEYIPAGTNRQDFFHRIQSAFNVSPSAPASASSSLANGLAAFVPIRRSPSPNVAADAQNQPSSPPSDGPSEAVNRVLAERSARLKAEKEEAERKAKEERAKAAERAKTADPGKNKQAEEIKLKKKQQEDERKRILRNIDADREERRLRATAREQRRIDNQRLGDVASALTNAPKTPLPSMTRESDFASLQVRLFDGSTIRSRFKASTTLLDVRNWVNENNKGGKQLPYAFKQVLTPLPNKTIDDTEESKTLGELGLVPSSTLVLIPIQKYSSAYDKGSSGGSWGSGLFSLFALFLSFFSWLGSLFSIFTGQRSTDEGSGPRRVEARQSDVDDRARDLRSRADRQREQQLYNGNSLNFEPRPDDEEEK